MQFLNSQILFGFILSFYTMNAAIRIVQLQSMHITGPIALGR